ncbi:MAG TPA: TetR/AcrR family transcriptional regulator [Chloroflexota bacterium]|nr:TetR/AcrR family transcriptional regulator [Chloroflexota bacterium]
MSDALTAAALAGRAAARHRAPAMSPEDRRAAIISATLPLLREQGANVTTSQIAQAAGIAEGTIFRVFPEKRELVMAALRTAMSADAEVARIAEIPLEGPLVERLVAALAATSDYQDRLWSLIRIFRDSGWHPEHDHIDQQEHHPRHEMERIGAAIASLFEPEKESLRLEPCAAARMLLGLAFANRIQEHGESSTAEQIVDLFLHGALADATPNNSKPN